jgi:UDP-N-acetylglucosamine diphosphorylase/glucosamine-1-phosphate N-acetyltransferase
MNYILFDEFITRKNMLPLTFVRPIGEIRFGILTMREKWEHFLGQKTSTLTENYLLPKYQIHEEDENVLINASFQPEEAMVKMVKKLKPNQALVFGDHIIAMYVYRDGSEAGDTERDDLDMIEYKGSPLKLNYPWDIFTYNGEAIRHDWPIVTGGKQSEGFGKGTHVVAPENVFVEEGAKISHALINASNGLVYIGKDAEIMEGAMIRGSLALCNNATIKMGTRVYGPTTIGPWSKVGGELDNVMIFGYSNKAHDGFLGNAVIAEWCNLGSDTNCSNLKNNYDIVKVWNYYEQKFIDTGLQFVGLIMGDHSKTGINTMLNTGTVVGVNANVFGSGFPRNFIPSFSWGGASGFINFDFDKAVEIAQRVFTRRNLVFDDKEISILRSIYQATHVYRK